MEWELQQAGFDYTYDKRLYDRLRRAATPTPVREHLCADRRVPGSFDALPREPRRAARGGGVPAAAMHKAAASWRSRRAGCASFTRGSSRGAAFTCRCTSGAGPAEPVDDELRAFYARLLGCPEAPRAARRRSGASRAAARRGRATRRTSSSSCRRGSRASAGCSSPSTTARRRHRATSPLRACRACRAQLHAHRPARRRALRTLRRRHRRRPLYLDMPPWGYNVFELTGAR